MTVHFRDQFIPSDGILKALCRAKGPALLTDSWRFVTCAGCKRFANRPTQSTALGETE